MTAPDDKKLIERMMEALEPFADVIRRTDDCAAEMGFGPSFDEYSRDWVFTFGQLRSAREAHAEAAARLEALTATQGEPWPQHVAYFDEGEVHWMSGIAPRDCELYTHPTPDRGELVEAATYAERLAVALHAKHYGNPEWRPLSGDLVGLLTQIDNLTSALTKHGGDRG